MSPGDHTEENCARSGGAPKLHEDHPIYSAMQKFTELDPYILHTGQHYDHALSESFFQDLDLPPPAFHLGVGSATPGEQIGRIIIACEQTFHDQRPDLVIVVGDVNSTLACALVAQKQFSSRKTNHPFQRHAEQPGCDQQTGSGLHIGACRVDAGADGRFFRGGGACSRYPSGNE